MTGAGSLSDMSMMDLFRMEAENHCATLTQNLLDLEQDPASPTLLESLMRAAHSVKGAARIVGLDPAVRIAHAMEDVFVAAQKRQLSVQQDHIDLLLKGVDLLTAVAHLADTETDGWFSEHIGQIAALTEKFSSFIEKRGGIPPAAPVEKPPTVQEQKGSPSLPSVKMPAAIDPGNMTMMDLFRMEAENHCSTLTRNLLALEQDSAAPTLLESLMRAAHSIKGAARIVELDPAVRLAHAMADVFVAAQKKQVIVQQGHIDLLLKGVDALTSIARLVDIEAEGWLSEHKGPIDDLVHALSSLLEKKKSAEAPALARPSSPIEAVAQPVSLPRPDISKDAGDTPGTTPKAESQAKKEDKGKDRDLRVSAEGMNRLMGLAGEVLVESRWLPSFAFTMLRLKRRQDELLQAMEKTRDDLRGIQSGIDDRWKTVSWNNAGNSTSAGISWPRP